MVVIKNFAHANELLAGFIPSSKNIRYTLERMLLLMKYLGNPQDKLKVIHVAGTSGKTSTSYYAAALLVESGFKVGLSVSPHIDSVAERAQINLRPFNEGLYRQELGAFLDLVSQSGLTPSYFEVLVAFSFWLFEKHKVNYAVIEVGLGGLLDGTNVIHRKDKICIITDIGYDHTEILGNTLKEIASQKAGIIYESNHVFMHAQDPEIMSVINEKSLQEKATLVIVSNNSMLNALDAYKKLPDFQQRNFSLAYAAIENIMKTSSDITAALNTYIPARMEAIEWSGKTIVLDGSHNEQKLAALVKAMKHTYKGKPLVIVASFGKNKAASLTDNLKILRKISSHIIITKFDVGQDEIRTAIDSKTIGSIAKEFGFMTEIQAEPSDAFRYALTQNEPIILVTGSFYLLNHIRPIIGLSEPIR
ncbi:MAG: hypothetical protein EOT05_01465 [Candidatus Microsaccharimonas sossegonensis]|uniref:tetrahydrofolate synthase n=1 Tax=Candidatus Microsaccharimonas sossegonensis TaxID=2506948 RepID=A0A4Q0AHD3_9BACT|nr:MAG: hypothetical protein EOT05_01465 [Candidatus Microsaccharimonas sossegonensis]